MLSSLVMRWLTAVMLAAVALPVQALLQIQHWQTASGARVYFVENHDLPTKTSAAPACMPPSPASPA